MYIFNVTPIAKPRMTRSDKWNERTVTSVYWAYKDELKLKANLQKYKIGMSLDILFFIPMDKSWNLEKRNEMCGTSHLETPDADNLVKGFMDALTDQDSSIWDIRARKYWYHKGMIIVLENGFQTERIVLERLGVSV